MFALSEPMIGGAALLATLSGISPVFSELETRLGFTVGGFVTAPVERIEGGESEGGLEDVNFLLSLEPLRSLRAFSEIEISEIAEANAEHRGLRSDPGLSVERLYAEASAGDHLRFRIGKFLAPIGIWSPAPAEPFVWTTSEPIIVEEVFDENVSGAMLSGSLFPRGATFSYSLFGTFLDPIAPDRGAPPADHSAGLHLEWASLDGWALGATYFASEPQDSGPHWNHLFAADFLWPLSDRIELSAEALVGEGTREEGALWGAYAQIVVETLPTLYAIARVERFDPPGHGRSLDLVDLGLTWIPVDWVRLKADYQIVDHFDDLIDDSSPPGLRASLSLLF